jgi:hypothetical protein
MDDLMELREQGKIGTRAYLALLNAGIDRLGGLAGWSLARIGEIPGIGRKTAGELLDLMQENGHDIPVPPAPTIRLPAEPELADRPPMVAARNSRARAMTGRRGGAADR